ncbi:hypothetical protein [Compostibacter hankyongensis]|uniref:DUF4625 domain-containing protein n=1 Tax=Compostibacter hankyongensis TaxID=1007089 RepID=A0ABP8FW18_9BACT
MKHRILPALLGGLLLTSCGKDKNFPSTPQITFKSISPLEYHGKTDQLSIVVGVKDAEGDLGDSVFYRQHISSDTLPWGSLLMPQGFPKQENLEGNIILQLQSQLITLPTNPGVPDTGYFDVFVRDRAGHISDTIQTDKILLILDQ